MPRDAPELGQTLCIKKYLSAGWNLGLDPPGTPTLTVGDLRRIQLSFSNGDLLLLATLLLLSPLAVWGDLWQHRGCANPLQWQQDGEEI